MLLNELKSFNIILASRSPRRHHLMKEAGLEFKLSDLHQVDESFPDGLDKFDIPVYLAELKSSVYNAELQNNDILITADTIVWFREKVINKPENRADAINILKELSGNMHEVITGVCLRAPSKSLSFYSHSSVYFSHLEEDEILYYIDKYEPFDKAGAYGIQEWIGYIGIKEIKGSFFNVMGLPIQQLYHKLGLFIND